jgi:hypothetical protein
MRFGCAAAYVLVALSGPSCEERGLAPADPPCLHPCDLAQTVRITVDEPAASIVVTGPCGGGIPNCPAIGGCSSAAFFLTAGGLAGDTGEMACHVTATAFDGRVVETDVIARYTGARCCSGYEFAQRGGVTLMFPPRDGG